MTTAKSIIAMRPRVFTIPPSAPFLPTLIKAMIDGKLGFRLPDDPLAPYLVERNP